MKRLILPALVVMILAGCSSASVAAVPSAPAVTPSSTQTVQDTPTSTATIAQWASVVAEAKASIPGWESDWRKAGCDVIGSGSLLCSLKTSTGALVAETTSIDLQIATNPSSDGYLGAPPSEIASLYAETQTAADDATTAGKVWQRHCADNDGASDDCVSDLFKLGSAMSALDVKLAAWEPYL